MPSGARFAASPAWLNRFRHFVKETILFDEGATTFPEVDEEGLTYTIVPNHVYGINIGPSIYNDTGYMLPNHVYSCTIVNN